MALFNSYFNMLYLSLCVYLSVGRLATDMSVLLLLNFNHIILDQLRMSKIITILRERR